MAETDAEARLEQQIKLLQGQINALSAQVNKLQRQTTHPAWKSYLKVTTRPNTLRWELGPPTTAVVAFDATGYIEITIDGITYKLARAT